MEISLEECKKYEGWLKKKSPKLFGGWQKRYFRILEGKLIVYSEKKDSKDLKGQIPFEHISNPESKDKTKLKFNLEGREFILDAETEENKNKWLYVISTLLKEIKGNEKNEDEQERIRSSTVKLNKLESMNKNSMDLLKQYGFGANDEMNISKELLSSKGISDLLNLDDPKIKSRIHYGFLFKHHKTLDYFQKRWFFIFSSRPLFDNLYNKDDVTFDEKKLKDWLKYDTLYYFKFKNDEKESDSLGTLELKNSHQIESIDKDTKYYLILDVEDRRFEFYSDTKGVRDIWYEVLKNSRRTAKEILMSTTKHPRNIDLLLSYYEKGEEQFKEKLDSEIKEIAGNYNEIEDINILEFVLNNLGDLILSTIDGCIVTKNDEMLTNYVEYMNNIYLVICQSFWNKNYSSIQNSDIINLSVLIFNFDDKINELRIIDPNLDKNANEFVKIYMKKTFQNLLDVIQNILRSEREVKALKSEEGYYYTNGPNDLFDIISNTFDLVKDFKIKEIYEAILRLFHECIIQYLIGVDCVINNPDIKIEVQFNLAIANNAFKFIQLITQFTDDIKELNVLNENQINDSFEIKKLMSSINMMSECSIEKFVNNFQNDMIIPFKNTYFMDLEINKILLKTEEIYGKYKEYMNPSVQKKTWDEILKLTLFFYIKSLLTTAYKKLETIESLREKIKNDKENLYETYSGIVGNNLTESTLKILNDIYDFLDVSSYMISSSCLILRQYIGPSFDFKTARILIRLRKDFSKDDIIDAENQCKEVLSKYVDTGNSIKGGFFEKIKSDIKIEVDDDIDDLNDEEEEKKEEEIVGISLDDFLNDDNSINDEEEKKEEEKKEKEVEKKLTEKEEVSDIIYEGIMEKKSKTSWQVRFFQLKNGYLYWFKDKDSSMIQNKISIKETMRVESHKENKFLMVINEGNDKEGRTKGKIYKFACNNEEEKQKWVNAITNEMKRLKGESEEKNETKLEIKIRKKYIKDYLKLPNIGSDRNFIKNNTLKSIENETFFQLGEKKLREIRLQKQREEQQKIKMMKLKEKEEKERKKKEEKERIEREKELERKKKIEEEKKIKEEKERIEKEKELERKKKIEEERKQKEENERIEKEKELKNKLKIEEENKLNENDNKKTLINNETKKDTLIDSKNDINQNNKINNNQPNNNVENINNNIKNNDNNNNIQNNKDIQNDNNINNQPPKNTEEKKEEPKREGVKTKFLRIWGGFFKK